MDVIESKCKCEHVMSEIMQHARQKQVMQMRSRRRHDEKALQVSARLCLEGRGKAANRNPLSIPSATSGPVAASGSPVLGATVPPPKPRAAPWSFSI